MINKRYESIYEEFNNLSEKEKAALCFLIDNIDFAEQLTEGEKLTDDKYKNLMEKVEENDDAFMKIFILYKYCKDHGFIFPHKHSI